MKLTILVEDAEPAEIRTIADAIWAAQKEREDMPVKARDALKQMSTTLHAEASRLEKKR